MPGPIWGDIRVKGNGRPPKNFGYNADFGTSAANLHDYHGTPVDASGTPLFKVLVPNALPEPATVVILGTGLVFLSYR